MEEEELGHGELYGEKTIVENEELGHGELYRERKP